MPNECKVNSCPSTTPTAIPEAYRIAKVMRQIRAIKNFLAKSNGNWINLWTMEFCGQLQGECKDCPINTGAFCPLRDNAALTWFRNVYDPDGRIPVVKTAWHIRRVEAAAPLLLKYLSGLEWIIDDSCGVIAMAIKEETQIDLEGLKKKLYLYCMSFSKTK